MVTEFQELGNFGEVKVVRLCACPKCKRKRTLKRLPANFKCADIICDFCGYIAQVKAARVSNIDAVPKRILAAAWGPQQERMKAAIYFPLFLILAKKGTKEFAVYYLSADLQVPALFRKRRPLSPSARRAGWQGFYYETRHVTDRFVRLEV